jgi:hypothetical protein
MINKDGFCGHCRTYHYPDRRYWNDCPNPHVPVPRAPQPSIEEIHAQRQQELREKFAAENLVKQREQERLERQKTLEKAMFQEDMRRVHQQQAEARDAKSAEVHAQMAEARAWIKAKAQVGRLERKLEAHAQEQHAKDQARSKALTEAIAARARRLKARRGQ